jgi:hypothetical protein
LRHFRPLCTWLALATLSDFCCSINVEESISTLKFADRAKQVMTQITINESRPVDHEMVMRLQREVKYLKQLLKQYTEKLPTMDILLSRPDELLQNQEV